MYQYWSYEGSAYEGGNIKQAAFIFQSSALVCWFVCPGAKEWVSVFFLVHYCWSPLIQETVHFFKKTSLFFPLTLLLVPHLLLFQIPIPPFSAPLVLLPGVKWRHVFPCTCMEEKGRKVKSDLSPLSLSHPPLRGEQTDWRRAWNFR